MDRRCIVCSRWFVGRRGSGQGKFCGDLCRFLGRVEVRGADECWPWLAALTGRGYGKFAIRNRVINAHRISFELFHGMVPEGLYVLHRCDNKVCVNPAHLFSGTAQDNTDDYWRKHPRAMKPLVPRRVPTACMRGHAYAEHAYVDYRGKHVCRVCRRALDRLKYWRRKVQMVDSMGPPRETLAG